MPSEIQPPGQPGAQLVSGAAGTQPCRVVQMAVSAVESAAHVVAAPSAVVERPGQLDSKGVYMATSPEAWEAHVASPDAPMGTKCSVMCASAAVQKLTTVVETVGSGGGPGGAGGGATQSPPS